MDGYGGKGNASQAKLQSMGRSVMQKKFKIDDGKNTHVDMNTLLEPANQATAQQHV